MRFNGLCLTVLFCMGAIPEFVSGQEFTTPEAIAAKKVYEAELEKLQKRYSDALAAAGKTAKKNGAIEEVDRIRNVRVQIATGRNDDPVVGARERMTRTKWTFNRPGKPNSLDFLPDRVVNLGSGGAGVWQMLEAQVGAIKLQNGRTGEYELFLFELDEQFKQFRVMAFGRIKTDFTVGRKIK